MEWGEYISDEMSNGIEWPRIMVQAPTSIARSRSRSADGEHTLLREKSGERLLAVACLMCPTSLLSPPCSEPARLRLKRDQPGSFANR